MYPSRLLKAIEQEIHATRRYLKETRIQREVYKAMEHDFMYGVEFARCQELTNQLNTLFRLRALAR